MENNATVESQALPDHAGHRTSGVRVPWGNTAHPGASTDQKKGNAMRLLKQLTLLPILLFVIACAYGQDIHYNYDRGANFSSYKTYQWVDAPTALCAGYVREWRGQSVLFLFRFRQATGQ